MESLSLPGDAGGAVGGGAVAGGAVAGGAVAGDAVAGDAGGTLTCQIFSHFTLNVNLCYTYFVYTKRKQKEFLYVRFNIR